MNQDTPPNKRTGWLSFGVIVAGAALAYLLYSSGPGIAIEEEIRAAKIVKVKAISPDRYPIYVSAYGIIIPAREVTIEPEVAGRVVTQHPQLKPGGKINQGEPLFAMETTLASIAVEEASASMVQAEINLEEARRRHNEASKLASDSLIPDTELASTLADLKLREAGYRRQKALLERSQVILARHEITSPFNAWVLEENVETGQQVDPGFSAATLVSADEYWVRVSLNVDQIKHIALPGQGNPGAKASIFIESAAGKYLAAHGEVMTLLNDLEPEGRMARMIIRIQNPSQPRDLPLLLGSYVKVEIAAGELDHCLAIPESALRNDQTLWVADAQNTLQIRETKVRWSLENLVYVDQTLLDGDRLIVSPMKSAVPGTALSPQVAVTP